MAIITRPHFYTSGNKAKSTEVNNDFNTIYNEFNGNIANANISATAAIVGSKLDLSSPGTIGGTTPGIATFTNLTATTITSGVLFVNVDTNLKAINIDSEASTESCIYYDQALAQGGNSILGYHNGSLVWGWTRVNAVASSACMRWGSYYLWIDSTGDLRIADNIPATDTSGNVIGDQTA